MSTKGKFLESLQIDLCGGTPSPEQLDLYDVLIIEEKVNLYWETFVSSIAQKNISSLNGLVKTYDNSGAGIPVFYDQSRAEYYSVIPGNIINVPNSKTSGVRWVEGLKSKEAHYIPISKDQASAMQELEVWTYDARIPYYIEFPEKIIFAKNPGPNRLLKMGLLVPFSNYDMNDYISMPDGQAAIIYDAVRKSFGLPTPDLINDNNPKTV